MQNISSLFEAFSPSFFAAFTLQLQLLIPSLGFYSQASAVSPSRSLWQHAVQLWSKLWSKSGPELRPTEQQAEYNLPTCTYSDEIDST